MHVPLLLNPCESAPALTGFVLLELRTGSHKCLACFVRRIFVEVLDEACSQVFSFNLPLGSVLVGVARIRE